MPRLYRDAPAQLDLGGIGQLWPRSTCWRALGREPEALPAFMAECEVCLGRETRNWTCTSRRSKERIGPASQARTRSGAPAAIVEDMGPGDPGQPASCANAPTFRFGRVLRRRELAGGENSRSTTYGTLPHGIAAKAIIGPRAGPLEHPAVRGDGPGSRASRLPGRRRGERDHARG